MTREEAIKTWLPIISMGIDNMPELKEAFDMAIKALETLEEFEKAQIITGGRLNGRTYAYKCGLEDGKRKALEQEPCEDCISREQALKELKESAEHHANDSREEVLLRRDRDIIRALPSVTPQEPILDKIRAEIEKAVWEDSIYSRDGSDEVRIPRLDPDDVFAILDKYKAGSEDK